MINLHRVLDLGVNGFDLCVFGPFPEKARVRALYVSPASVVSVAGQTDRVSVAIASCRSNFPADAAEFDRLPQLVRGREIVQPGGKALYFGTQPGGGVGEVAGGQFKVPLNIAVEKGNYLAVACTSSGGDVNSVVSLSLDAEPATGDGWASD